MRQLNVNLVLPGGIPAPIGTKVYVEVQSDDTTLVPCVVTVPEIGRAVFAFEDCAKMGGANVLVIAKGGRWSGRQVLPPLGVGAAEGDSVVLIPGDSSPFDPATVSLVELASIRGALWTVKGNYPLGPRPNRDDNIFAMDYLEAYDVPTQLRGLQAYRDRGYTHGPIGPLVDGGYRGDFPPEDFRTHPDDFADVLQRMWDHGILPVFFCSGGDCKLATLRPLESIFTSPRFQQLCRIVVPGGWEPSRLTPDQDWIDVLKWGAAIFPNALRLVHMQPGHNEPGNWNHVAPWVHGWLVQNDEFSWSQQPVPDFLAQFDRTQQVVHFDRRSLTSRFITGFNGWPRSSAWGEGHRVKVYAGEYASYWVYHQNRSEAHAQGWGNAAMLAGADGFFDGATMAVP